jgi:hypothetical protein
MIDDARIRRRLWLVLLAYETLVIAIVAAADSTSRFRPEAHCQWPRRSPWSPAPRC